MTRLIALVPTLILLALSPARGADSAWSWPVPGASITRGFDAPESEYGPGHRGVDIPAPVGSPVRAVAPGTVVFVGPVGDTVAVTIDHGTEQSTYVPVIGAVTRGQAVVTGDVIGTLAGGHCSTGCLHLGRKRGDTYLDPAELLGGVARVRLVSPEGPPPVPRTPVGSLAQPVPGPVTSAFGWRTHPVTGERSFHDGIDFGAPCGTPVRSASAGVVTRVVRDRAYGLRTEVATGSTVLSYSHLSASSVAAGQQVGAGDEIGRVGSTGTSTGCHLHFSVHVDTQAVDPAGVL